MLTFNASNRLYNGECGSIREAFGLMIAQYQQEMQWIRTKYLADFPEDGQQGLAELGTTIAKVEQCREEYTAAIEGVAQALFAQWQASDDEDIARIGEAALTQDYSRLAL